MPGMKGMSAKMVKPPAKMVKPPAKGLTAKQKANLPPALQKAILAKRK